MEPTPSWISPEVFVWLRENARVAALFILFAPGAVALLAEAIWPRRQSQPAPEEPPRTEPPSTEPLSTEPLSTEPLSAEPASLEPAEPVPAPAPEAVPEPVAVSEPAPAPPPAAEAIPPEPVAAPVSLRERLARTSETLVGRLGAVLGGRPLDAELMDELEAALFTADLGVATAESLLERVKKEAAGADASRVREILRDSILEKLNRVEPKASERVSGGPPHVVLVLGVNGSGKTTSIGKLAARHAAEGRKVVLGAADTFRAAAIDQLQVWGERVGCTVVAGEPGGDPAAVAFDTVKAAVAEEADIALIDTAGRLQTKKPLMEELGKIARVLGRDVPGAPHETLLVLDSNTGQNAISQTRLFTEVTQVTGLVLTKLDGSAKGGVIVGLADEFGIPVQFVGVGEGIEDLRNFQAAEFVDALFGDA